MSLFDMPATSSIDKLVLERLKVGVRQHVGAHVVEGLRLEQWVEPMTGDLVYRLTTDVLAEKLPPESVERSSKFFWEFPASPFQHWKQKHDGAWWLRRFVRRFPVRRTRYTKTCTLTVDLERYRTFPKCDYAFPEKLGGYVNVAIARPTMEWM